GRVPLARAVVVGAEDVDRTVEAAVKLVGEVDDVGAAVRRRPTLVRRADDDPVLVVAVRRRPGPDGPVLPIRVQARQELGEPVLELALARPRVEADPEALQRALDLLEHDRHRIALGARQLVDVRALVAVLRRLLPAPARLDRGPEA